MPMLPNLHKATIDRRKITHYLLARDHPTGRAKAAFFEGFGFHSDWPEILEMRLITHAHQNEVTESIETEFGTKFIITGPIDTPIGVSARICVAWFCANNASSPQLVTAFPD
jgi:hypothetical protein